MPCRHGDRWATGWYSDANLLLQDARERAQAGNLFISLNRPGPRTVSNRMVGSPVVNDDIQFYTRLFFDFDPVRAPGIPSTDSELRDAIRQARDVLRFTRALGWPDPLQAISGNGCHLLFRTYLPNVAESRDQLREIYKGLAQDYSTEQVDLDRTVCNPGRICTLYGSRKRKGPDTPERPHRTSKITVWPDDWKQVSRRQVEYLAGFYARRNAPTVTRNPSPQAGMPVSGRGDYSTLDVVAWFSARGLYQHHIEDVLHAVTP